MNILKLSYRDVLELDPDAEWWAWFAARVGARILLQCRRVKWPIDDTVVLVIVMSALVTFWLIYLLYYVL